VTYDPHKNAKESYDVAVAECRRRLVMSRADLLITTGRQKLAEEGLPSDDAHLVHWLANIAVAGLENCSPGYMRAKPPVIKPAKPRVEAIE